MSSARRTLLTATAAGTLLGALWFVPSANASVDTSGRGAGPAASTASTASTAQVTEQGLPVSAAEEEPGTEAVPEAGPEGASASRDGTELAATGSIDTTPYVIGGTLFLVLGAGFVVYSVRRERFEF
ncbi:LPXTG cell wall anchor domain-containing protein [Streptomyces kebangsaanensis]|uniref:LPXTG cell wall anchor domain-containing protein n=1 Tax=Streptomyces kebangsaanensis TaxID=864058 RepID=A0ABW6KXZ3_9ACTN